MDLSQRLLLQQVLVQFNFRLDRFKFSPKWGSETLTAVEVGHIFKIWIPFVVALDQDFLERFRLMIGALWLLIQFVRPIG